MKHCGRVANVVLAQEPGLELLQQTSAVAVSRTPQEGREVGAPGHRAATVHGDRAHHLDLAVVEGREVGLEGPVLLVEADVLEPAVEGSLRRPHHTAVDQRGIALGQGVEEADVVRIVRRELGGGFAGDVGFHELGLNALPEDHQQGPQHQLAQVEAGNPKPRVVFETLVRDEAAGELPEDRHILADPLQWSRGAAGLQTVDDPTEVAGKRCQQAHHRFLGVAPIRFRRHPRRVRPEVLETKIELRRIVAVGVKGEGLREDADEGPVGFPLEAHLPGVKRVGEAQADPKPLDAELEPGKTAGALRRALQRVRCFGFSPDS